MNEYISQKQVTENMKWHT